MSALYEFRKLYVDVIAPTGEVAVLYLVAVRLAGRWTTRRGVEHFAPDGARRAVDLDAPPVPTWEAPLAEARPILGTWAPPPSPLGPVLDWRVKHARAQVDLAWAGTSVSGVGYADWVRITRPTRLLGLRSLLWGRVHLPDRTIVFERLDTARGSGWSPGIEWRVGEAEPRSVEVEVSLGRDGDGRVRLGDGDLTLEPLRVLHDGDAFDPERVPGAGARWLCRTLGGATWETRWLGRGVFRGAAAPVLYERVRFG